MGRELRDRARQNHGSSPRLARLLGVVIAASIAAGCTLGAQEPTELAVVPLEATATVAPTAVPTTAPLAVPTPTARPVATATPLPTATPQPTVTPEPTATVEPTATPTAEPTPAPLPTATTAPAPTATTEPTATPEPTATTEPTVEPTATPEAEPETTPEPEGEGGPPAQHVITEVGHVTLGQAGKVSLRLPASRIELLGFHEASHPGSQGINAANTGAPTMLLDSRGRGTDARSAADIVVPPGEPLRAPVTGTVISARSYILYCQYTDQLVYIEPDGLPGWQVRLFHVTGDVPAVGTRVVAGETIVATGGANPLPFESQIDEFTAEPSWPHVHLEVVDTSVPDDRPPGGGC